MSDRIAESNTFDHEDFEPGEYLTLTTGDHDFAQDYGPYFVVKPFSNTFVIEAYVEAFRPKQSWDRPDTVGLIAFLMEHSYIIEPETVHRQWRTDEHLDALARERRKA